MTFLSFCKTLPRFIPVSSHKEGRLISESIERTFHYYISNKSLGPFPLVFVLHGGGGNGQGMIYLTRLSEIADRDGFIVVYPNGYGNRWNDGRDIKHSITDQKKIDDVAFLRKIIAFFKSSYQIDDFRIHVVGLSNGGFMAQRVICEASDVFASGFSIAATTTKFLANNCVNAGTSSMGFIFGKKDDVIPFLGGTILIPANPNNPTKKVPAGESLSFMDSLGIWKQRLHCEMEEKEYIQGLKKKYPKEILKFTFRNCQSSSLLDGYLIESGGHFWPHGFYYLNESNYGFLTQDMDASATVIDFFKRTGKPVKGDK